MSLEWTGQKKHNDVHCIPIVLCPSTTQHPNSILTFALGDNYANSEAVQVLLQLLLAAFCTSTCTVCGFKSGVQGVFVSMEFGLPV